MPTLDRSAFTARLACVTEKLLNGTLTAPELLESIECEGPDRESPDPVNLEPRKASTSIGAYVVLNNPDAFMKLSENDPLGYAKRSGQLCLWFEYIFFPIVFDCLSNRDPWLTNAFSVLFPTPERQAELARWVVDENASAYVADRVIISGSAEFLQTCLEYASSKSGWKVAHRGQRQRVCADFTVELLVHVINWLPDALDGERLAKVLDDVAEGQCYHADGHYYRSKGTKRVVYPLGFWRREAIVSSEKRSARLAVFKRLFASATPLQLFLGVRRAFQDERGQGLVIPPELWQYVQERFKGDERYMLAQVRRNSYWNRRKECDMPSIEIDENDGVVYVHQEERDFHRRMDSGREFEDLYPQQINVERIKDGEWVAFSRPSATAVPFYRGYPRKYLVTMFY